MLGAFAPALPPLVELGGALALILAWAVALGFLYVYRRTLKWALVRFADLLDAVRVGAAGHYAHPFGPVSSFLRTTAETIDHAIAFMVIHTEGGIVRLLHLLASQARTLGRLLSSTANTIEHRFHGLLLAFPPAAGLWLAVRAAQHLPDVWRAIHGAKATATAAVASAARARTTVSQATRAYVARAELEAIAAASVAVAGTRTWAGGRFRSIERDYSGVRSRLGKLEGHLTKAGAAALVGTALVTLGIGRLRCSNIRRNLKRVCGMDADLLDDLLLGTLAVIGTISLVETAKDLQGITGAAVDFTHALIREV